MLRTPDGRELCAAEWGDPNGWPVLSLHGTPGCRLPGRSRIEGGYEEVVRSLEVRVITYDRPGCGRSTRQFGRRVVDAVSDIATVADALGVARFAVIGGSGGSAPALAAAALLGDRVVRIVAYAPMAPYDRLGHEEWSRGQDPEVREYIGWVLEGEARMTPEFTRMDAEQRAEAVSDDPADASVFEQTLHGVGGWVDDEASHVRPWGFDPASISAPTAIWYDPDEVVLPRQHGEWLARNIPGATLVVSKAFGHGSTGDPVPEWRAAYAWLAQDRSGA